MENKIAVDVVEIRDDFVRWVLLERGLSIYLPKHKRLRQQIKKSTNSNIFRLLMETFKGV